MFRHLSSPFPSAWEVQFDDVRELLVGMEETYWSRGGEGDN